MLFCRREANQIADELPKMAPSYPKVFKEHLHLHLSFQYFQEMTSSSLSLQTIIVAPVN